MNQVTEINDTLRKKIIVTKINDSKVSVEIESHSSGLEYFYGLANKFEFHKDFKTAWKLEIEFFPDDFIVLTFFVSCRFQIRSIVEKEGNYRILRIESLYTY